MTTIVVSTLTTIVLVVVIPLESRARCEQGKFLLASLACSARHDKNTRSNGDCKLLELLGASPTNSLRTLLTTVRAMCTVQHGLECCGFLIPAWSAGRHVVLMFHDTCTL